MMHLFASNCCQGIHIRWIHKQVQCKYVTRFADGVVGLGVHRTCSLTSHKTFTIESLLGNSMESRQVYAFNRVIVWGMAAHTFLYCSCIKRNNCYFTPSGHSCIYTLYALRAHLNCCFCSVVLCAGNSDATVFLLMLTCCNILSTFTIMVFIWLHAQLSVLNRNVLAWMMAMDVALQLLCQALSWTNTELTTDTGYLTVFVCNFVCCSLIYGHFVVHFQDYIFFLVAIVVLLMRLIALVRQMSHRSRHTRHS